MNVTIYSPFYANFKAKASIVYTKRLRKGVKVLMGVVLGALVLMGLYTLFGDTILPTLNDKVTELFNYAG